LADQAVGANERGQAGLDRDTALADRGAGANERGEAGRDKLRSYDLIIRFGGDEFVCAISGLDLAEARQRLALVNTCSPKAGSMARSRSA
jgi:hypothetical protein